MEERSRLRDEELARWGEKELVETEHEEREKSKEETTFIIEIAIQLFHNFTFL